MRRRNSVACVLTALALGSWGCASAPPAPAGWLRNAPGALNDPRGGWIEVEVVDANLGRYYLDGELLAVDAERIHITKDGVIGSVPVDSVASATLAIFDPMGATVVGTAIAGMFATISNGYFLIFTAPAWLAIGAGAAGSRSGDGTLVVEEHGWHRFRMFARFPQGLPAGFTPADSLPAPQPPPVLVTEPPSGAWSWKHGPRAEKAAWAGLGLGSGFVDEEGTGLAYLFSLNAAYKWFMVGTRFMSAQLDVQFSGEPAPDPDANILDLGLMLGVRFNYRAIHATVSAGPAARGVSLSELTDFWGTLGAQGEFYVFPYPNLGFGTTVGYNWNDLVDFYVVSLGLAIGTP